jgi:two-component system nitrate/nitrite response regulator NarL
MSYPHTCASGVVVADEHAVFVDAAAAVLEQNGHDVVGVAMTLGDLIAEVRRRRPLVCVAGEHFPDGATLDALPELASACPDTRVIVLSGDRSPKMLQRVLDAGGSGLVHKSRGMRVLLDAMQRVAAGEVVVECSLIRGTDGPSSRLAELTNRELQCLTLLAEGLDTRRMARRLNVSPATVRTHVQSVLVKLGVHSRLEAAAFALRTGVLTGEHGRGGGIGSRPA